MTTKIYKTYEEFLKRQNKKENGVSQYFADAHPDFENQNLKNEASWNCSRCYGCSNCYDCSRCSRCSDCSGCSRCSDCSGCSNCYDCSRCSGCSDCSGCSRCSGCSSCSRCSRCSDCSGCSRCSGCSNCSNCSGCSNCSNCYGCSNCSDCSGCSGCSSCYDCSRCSGCSDCSGCSRCSDCSGCSDCYDLRDAKSVSVPEINSWFDVPVIKNIHQLVLNSTKQPNALDMKNWHTCETTHCRAGWVVQLAGEKGKALEEASSTQFAAMQIYKASSTIKVSLTRFFETNEVAMADIERCAAEELRLNEL